MEIPHMSTGTPKAVRCVEDLEPYTDAQAISFSDPARKSFLKLNCNEATYPPSPLVKKRMVEFIEKDCLNWYPDTKSHDLKQALSRHVGFEASSLSTFNGCDHALETVCRAYLEKGDEVVMFVPTYDHFRVFAETAGGTVIPVRARSPFESHVEGLLKVMSPRTKMIYLNNPTNPTGLLYTPEEIDFVLKHSRSALVVVDEAYIEFGGQSSLPFLRRYPNLIVARSFSKAFALAGLRCGYLVSDPHTITTLEKIRNGKNVNSLAQVAATAALEDLPYYKNQIRMMQEAKAWFVQEVREMGLTVIDTVANFVLVHSAFPEEMEKALQAQQVYVRNRSHFAQLQGYLRITVGTKLEMTKVLNVLGQLKTSPDSKQKTEKLPFHSDSVPLFTA